MEKTGENMKEIFETLLKARDTCGHMHVYHMHTHTYIPRIHEPHVGRLTHIRTDALGHVYMVTIPHTAHMYNVLYAKAQ